MTKKKAVTNPREELKNEVQALMMRFGIDPVIEVAEELKTNLFRSIESDEESDSEE